MSNTAWIVIGVVVAVLVIAALVVWTLIARRKAARRSSRLRRRFGLEYEAMVGQHGKRRGEHLLEERLDRFGSLDTARLQDDERERFRSRWTEVQMEFIDDPVKSVRDAEDLVVAAMRDRGYPVDDFDHRVAALSVDHPDVAPAYRDAHDALVALEGGTRDIAAMYDAVRRYRRTFEDLVETRPQQPA